MNHRLFSHIEYALMAHQCVVVPGMGGFFIQTNAAKYDLHKHIAYPPEQTIHFNTQLSHRDGLLEESYAKYYGLSLRKARIMLEEDIALVKQELVKKRDVYMNHLGTLTLNNNGNMFFVADKSGNNLLSAGAYGLGPASMPLLNDVLEQVHQPQMILENNQEDKIEEISENVINSTSEDNTIFVPKEKSIKLSIPVRHIEIAAAIILIVMSVIPLKSFTSHETTKSQVYNNASFIPSEYTAKNLWKVEVADPNESKIDAGKDEIVFLSEGSDNVSKRYFIVLATFKDDAKIEAFYNDKVKNANLANAGILRGKNLKRAYAEIFDNSKDAYNYLTQLVKQHPEFGTAWVYFCD